MKIKRKNWSKNEVELLKKLSKAYIKGEITIEEIAKIFNRSKEAVKTKMERENIPFREREIDKINYKFLEDICKQRKIKI